MDCRARLPVILVVALGTGAVRPVAAQQLEPAPAPADQGAEVRVVPGGGYEAGPLHRFFNGDNWRDLWVRPLSVQVLDLDRFGGGLEPVEAGGNQSRTLHLRSPDERTFIFRSTQKYTDRVLPEDLRGTAFQRLMQDHISIFHPAAGLVVPALHDSLGLLGVPAVMRVMPDDPRLGEFDDPFAGMLGLVVERPDEGPDDQPLWRGYTKIVGMEELLEKLAEHPRNRVDAREYLASRLIDFLVNDPDRGPDQWRWAREEEDWGHRWRPIARDRDWAFMNADGFVARLARLAFPKLLAWGPKLPDLTALTWAAPDQDRRLLASLDRSEWDAVVAGVREGLSDPVIAAAVDGLPPGMQPGHRDQLESALRARRDRLHVLAVEFYATLAEAVDVRGTDAPERAEVLRRPDGSLEVRLLAADTALRPLAVNLVSSGGPAEERAWRVYYQRLFDPSETREVRIHLRGGDDTAVVRGQGTRDIRVRVIGGDGDDALFDEGEPGRATVLYDTGDGTVFGAGRGTRIDRRPFDPPSPAGTWFQPPPVAEDVQPRDWGRSSSLLTPVLGYSEGAGLVVGAGPVWTWYGFRHYPYQTRISARGLVATATGGLGVEAGADYRFENLPLGARVAVRASQFEATRFYGYGNDTPHLPPEVGLVMQDRVSLSPGLTLETPRWDAALGPLVRYTSPRTPAASPAVGALGSEDMLEAGAVARVAFDAADDDAVPTRGVRASLEAAAFPAVDGRGDGHAGVDLELRGYAAAPFLTRPVLALRLGGSRAWGDFPIHEAAWVGGRTTLRGYRWQRFAGDAAAWGSAELRVPLFRANLWLVKGRVGVLGLVDAGRVWVDGASPGGWHTGHGAGLFLETLGTGLNVVWARGEENRLYAGVGVPF